MNVQTVSPEKLSMYVRILLINNDTYTRGGQLDEFRVRTSGSNLDKSHPLIKWNTFSLLDGFLFLFTQRQ
jgi:hypothetical protein